MHDRMPRKFQDLQLEQALISTEIGFSITQKFWLLSFVNSMFISGYMKVGFPNPFPVLSDTKNVCAPTAAVKECWHERTLEQPHQVKLCNQTFSTWF